MAVPALRSNVRPPPDRLFVEIAEFSLQAKSASEEALDTARWCLLDAMACGILALRHPACTKLLGPQVPGLSMTAGARVPGTRYELDPVSAAFNIGAIIRWLDFNDTWLAAEWGHPSDNLGAILAVADWLGRQRAAGLKPAAFSTPLPPGRELTVGDLLAALVKTHEIQGVLALDNAFNRAGLDHVLLVRVACAALSVALMGGSREQAIDAVSQAWLDGSSLRTYRHAPNTGPRKSWAAGDAAGRGVRLALLTMAGEIGYPSALTAKIWGFQDASFRGQPVKLAQPFGCYVMENVLFKVSFPAEFHAQTAVECAIRLHPLVKDRLDEIDRVEISTHESAMRIIDKTGPLHNPADRDHCLQYMTAIGLIHGALKAADYEDQAASDSRIDALRVRMTVSEHKRYSRDYLDPGKRSIASAVQVFFRDGSSTGKIAVEYPLGHRRRRAEGLPLLKRKALAAFEGHYGADKARSLVDRFEDRATLSGMPARAFMDLFVPSADSPGPVEPAAD
ncbi:MAG: bifunctional 2-methylcitrate dehydratase/aconitate hydratase [Opitutaceae bacterium]